MKESYFDRLLEDLEPFVFIDVGAMSIVDEPYQPLIERGRGHVVGFEPQVDECEKLQKMNSTNKNIFIPSAVGDGDEHTFFECNFPMTSSLFRPNKALVSAFHNLGNLMEVVRETTLKTKRLDDIPEARGADYIKLDAQGAELDILRNCHEVLKSVLIVHTEVEFVPLYENQPLFADVDTELRNNGFMFHQFTGTAGRAYKPLHYSSNINVPISQTLWADAVYVRDITNIKEMPTHQILKMAVLLDILYSSFDLSSWLLGVVDQRSGFGLQKAYNDFQLTVHGHRLSCQN